jgi:plastocyanin
MRKVTWAALVMFAVVAPGVRVWHDIRPAGAAMDHVVKVDDSDRDQQKWTFVPAEVTVAVGDSVTWDMHQPNGQPTSLPHSSTADDGSWDSSYISPGEKWSHTFDKAGDYKYHCTPHPWKKGVIHVK